MTKIKINFNLCVHCGACTGICQSDAFVLDKKTAILSYIDEKCVSCGLCAIACPLKAISK